MCMGTKNISIMEDVYKMLLTKKIASESFSDIIRRTIKEKRDIMEFAGAWKEIGMEEVNGIKANIEKIRKKSTKELSNRIKRLDI